MALVRNTIKFSSGGGSDIIVVANYSALPDPTTVSGQFYWCSASQGTSWLPGSLGGTYYNSGMYYSNGATWEFINVPYQATQTEVNTGTNTDKFVTPSTLKNQDYLATIPYADAKVEDVIVNGVTDKAPSQNAVFDAFNNLDPLVKRRYFDDLQGFGNGAFANSIFFGSGNLEFEGNIFITRLGTGATFARTSAELGRGGIIRGGTGTTNGGINLIQFRSIWLGTEDFVAQTSVRIQNLSDATNRFTLNFSNGVGVVNSMRFFYSDNVNSGKWQIETYSSSVSTLVDSGVSVSANTWYDLKLCRIGMVCYFYINNILVATISTNIPSGIESFCGTTFTKTAGTTSRTCDFDYLKFFDLR